MREGFLFMMGAFACSFLVIITLLVAMFAMRLAHGVASKIKARIKKRRMIDKGGM